MLPPALEKLIEVRATEEWNTKRREFWVTEKELRQYLKDLPIFAFNFFPEQTQKAWEKYAHLLNSYLIGMTNDGDALVDAYIDFMEGLRAWRTAIEAGYYLPDEEEHPTGEDCANCEMNWVCLNL